METFLGEVKYLSIPPYRMAKSAVISSNPEDEVINYLVNWVKSKGIDIRQCRCFGFDVPVAEADKAKDQRGYEYWISVPEHIVPEANISIFDFAGGDYIAMQITDPFLAPFERIPKGWNTLVEYIKRNNINVDGCSLGGCLEEVLEENHQTYMDIMIKLKK